MNGKRTFVYFPVPAGIFVEANIIYVLLGESLQETRTKRRNNQLNIV